MTTHVAGAEGSERSISPWSMPLMWGGALWLLEKLPCSARRLMSSLTLEIRRSLGCPSGEPRSETSLGPSAVGSDRWRRTGPRAGAQQTALKHWPWRKGVGGWRHHRRRRKPRSYDGAVVESSEGDRKTLPPPLLSMESSYFIVCNTRSCRLIPWRNQKPW